MCTVSRVKSKRCHGKVDSIVDFKPSPLTHAQLFNRNQGHGGSGNEIAQSLGSIRGSGDENGMITDRTGLHSVLFPLLISSFTCTNLYNILVFKFVKRYNANLGNCLLAFVNYAVIFKYIHVIEKNLQVKITRV